MTKIAQSLIDLYQQMHELTEPECAHACNLPRTCCSRMYCDMATEIAEQFGVKLEVQDHPTLPYMSPTGCVVPPYLRPLCSVHTCEIGAWGFKRNDPGGKWTKAYFKLRAKINSHPDTKKY